MNALPNVMSSESELDDVLSGPDDKVVRALANVEGDLLILGVGGKMGPTLARLAVRAIEQGQLKRRVIGVSRFSAPTVERGLQEIGVETIGCDLLEDGALDRLPDAANVVFMAGRKFGSTGAESLTWAMNTYLPALVARRYRDSRLVVFSTGNVYPLVPMASGGATEDDAPGPVGEYAQSCLGRERLVEHVSRQYGTRSAIVRLNYAIDLRYGVLLDVAQKVWAGQPIDVRMGNVNVIWQGDANRAILRCLPLAAGPPLVLNLTGPETISIRQVAHRFAALFDRPAPEIVGEEAPTALLSNAARAHALFGYPSVPLDQMLRWVAHWVKIGGPVHGKPTHFEERTGRF